MDASEKPLIHDRLYLRGSILIKFYISMYWEYFFLWHKISSQTQNIFSNMKCRLLKHEITSLQAPEGYNMCRISMQTTSCSVDFWGLDKTIREDKSLTLGNILENSIKIFSKATGLWCAKWICKNSLQNHNRRNIFIHEGKCSGEECGVLVYIVIMVMKNLLLN